MSLNSAAAAEPSSTPPPTKMTAPSEISAVTAKTTPGGGDSGGANNNNNGNQRSKMAIPYPTERPSPEEKVSRETSTVPYVPKTEYASNQGSLESLGGTNFADAAILPNTSLPCQEKVHWELVPLPHIPAEGNVLPHDLNLLHSASHADPFAVLGPHAFTMNGNPYLVARVWIKDSASVKLRLVPDLGVVTKAPKNDSMAEGDAATAPATSESAKDDDWCQMIQHSDGSWLHQLAFIVRSVDSKVDLKSVKDIMAEVAIKYECRVVYNGDASATPYTLGDAYSTGLVLPEYDLKLFQSGSCWHVDNLMGSHICQFEGAKGVRFAVWAPSAKFVSVVGDFNQWDGRSHPMRKRHEFGVWELFIPTTPQVGHKYGYQIHGPDGAEIVKIDPYAQEFEDPPAHASMISACDDPYKKAEHRFRWTDSDWMKGRNALAEDDKIMRIPMSIYEVHLPSWMRGDNNTYLSYRELAPRLAAHLKKMNFTHVEFMPLCHHPFEGSWGYQLSGLYAPYARLGSADDLKYLINYLHEQGFGVFIDFVPAHFVKDDWALVRFDGSPCYEYADPREGEHKGWGTMIFNFRRNEVRSFLLGAAYHWLRRYHVDGLRIDAVSSMLYKNYCREPGDWIPNEQGGEANLEAITLLQEMNYVIHREFPGVFMMAEEATSWAGVTDKKNGLGFDAKWDLGWMNDTLSYLCNPPPMRRFCHNLLTFRGLYVAHESWVLPLSHDEVVSGKGSLLDKCGFAGSPFPERLQTMRALYGYQMGLQGRPLLFMGGEFGQGREWKENRSLDWHEAKEEARSKLMVYVSDLLALYKNNQCLHAGDDEPWNFMWVDCDNADDNIIAWIRKYQEWYNDILIICNFSGNFYRRYPIGLPHGGAWQVLMTSDDWKYGGAMRGPGNNAKIETTQGGRLGWPYCLWVDIPPFTCMYLKAPSPKPQSPVPLPGITREASPAATTKKEK